MMKANKNEYKKLTSIEYHAQHNRKRKNKSNLNNINALKFHGYMKDK